MGREDAEIRERQDGMKTEKEWLDTLETYMKIIKTRIGDGKIVQAHEDTATVLLMIDQRKRELGGNTPWT